MEFAEITQDPFTNKTNNYFLMLDIFLKSIPVPSGPGFGGSDSGVLYDPNGNEVGYYWSAQYQDYELTGSLQIP